MRLYPLGPGEILDRLTILSLKILHGEEAGKPTTHWEAEQDHLRASVTLYDVRPVAWDLIALAAVNGALWEAEDELRARRRAGKFETDEAAVDACLLAIANLAMKIQSLNDRRAALVHEINCLLGAEAPKEKLT